MTGLGLRARRSAVRPGADLQRSRTVTYLPLDYRDPNTIEAIVKALPRVDVLINNAGVGQAGAVEDVPVDAARELFEINVFGPWGLAHA
jgi:short-subunit dehydrogenase